MAAKYDRLGVHYAPLRRTDHRIANALHAALGDARTVLNVGAGTGSYEPAGRDVTAVEPSIEMIRQRPASGTRVVQAYAEELPFEEDSFDASMTVLTVHHWHDKGRGLTEMHRVTRGPIVLLTFDPSFRGAWLTDYFPQLIELDAAQMPELTEYSRWLGPVVISPVLIPHDCSDGFLYAYWRRPEAYLDPRIRSGSSSFWSIQGVDAGVRRLQQDLDSGDWARKYGALLDRDAIDLGYRLVVANGRSPLRPTAEV
jgi:SAM-dependent methyltransferase